MKEKFNPDTRCSGTLFIDFRVVYFVRHVKRSDGHIDLLGVVKESGSS